MKKNDYRKKFMDGTGIDIDKHIDASSGTQLLLCTYIETLEEILNKTEFIKKVKIENLIESLRGKYLHLIKFQEYEKAKKIKDAMSSLEEYIKCCKEKKNYEILSCHYVVNCGCGKDQA